jgi:3-dehydroquinate synthase
VDSSVGGKTAIDLKAGKNLAGAFHQPSLVITDTDIIRALPEEQFASGAAEIIKCGMLFDPDLFAMMEKGDWQDNIDEIIEISVSHKRDIVAKDEFDTGMRNLLNLGHTFGHAIEKCSGLTILHGQGVAIGMMMAANAAGLDKAMVARLENCLKANGLPVSCDYTAEALTAAALSDKKRAGGSITLVLPLEIGRCELKKIPVEDLKGYFERALHSQEANGQ